MKKGVDYKVPMTIYLTKPNFDWINERVPTIHGFSNNPKVRDLIDDIKEEPFIEYAQKMDSYFTSMKTEKVAWNVPKKWDNIKRWTLKAELKNLKDSKYATIAFNYLIFSHREEMEEALKQHDPVKGMNLKISQNIHFSSNYIKNVVSQGVEVPQNVIEAIETLKKAYPYKPKSSK